MEFVIGFTKNNLTVHLHFISFTCQNQGIKERSVQLCQSVLYILSAWIVHECDEMQTAHKIIVIIQLSGNKFWNGLPNQYKILIHIMILKGTSENIFYAKIKLT